MKTATVKVFGDILEVIWNGNVWVSPTNGQQHSRRREAMATELRFYFEAGGDDPDDEETAEEIEGYLDNIQDGIDG